MSGPPPKPAHLRARTNRKTGAASIESADDQKVPAMANPDKRAWHPLTLAAWKRAWASPMASQWLETDADALGRLAILWDEFYQKPKAQLLAEIRLQEQRFGLSPLDRSRLQWEVSRAEDGERRQQQRKQQAVRRTGTDPRSSLMAVK